MELKEKILHVSRQLFFQRGLKSISIDDICADLGISKKTLYTVFSSKDEIISNLIEDHIQSDIEAVEKIRSNSTNSIDELLAICEFNCEQHKAMNPIFVHDLKKHYPQEWAKVETFLSSHIYNCIIENIKRGQEEEYFRKDIHSDFIAMMHMKGLLNMVEYFSNQQVLSFEELDKEFLNYHICAIGTNKAIKKLNKLRTK